MGRPGADASTALDAALAVLAHLAIAEPPLSPRDVLAGLHLRLRTMPAFDLDLLSPPQRRTFGSVRGLLNPANATMYVREDVSPRQEPWIIYHETGHAMIEWHRDLLYLDTDYSLSPRVRERMEREANEFAGHLQFFGPQFAAEARELPFAVSSALTLAERYDSSVESSLRRYIETHDETCICNVFQIIADPDGRPTLRFHYFVKPRKHRTRWDFPYTVGQLLPPCHPLVQALNDGRLGGGNIIEAYEEHPATNQVYHRQIFSTGYAVFVLIRQHRLRP